MTLAAGRRKTPGATVGAIAVAVAVLSPGACWKGAALDASDRGDGGDADTDTMSESESGGPTDPDTSTNTDGDWMWEVMESGTDSSLADVWGTSESDVFAVGVYGTILHYDGISWSQMDSPVNEHLGGIWGSSPTDVFAVGEAGAVAHYDGASWTSTSLGSYDLSDVWGRSSGDVLAVGHEGAVWRFDGGAWSPVGIDGLSVDLHAVWCAPGADAYAVGHENDAFSSTDIVRISAEGGSHMEHPVTDFLYAVAGLAPQAVYAAGWQHQGNAEILGLSGGSWSVVATQPDIVLALDVDSDGGLWAAGRTSDDDPHGVVHHRLPGGGWAEPLHFHDVESLSGVWSHSDSANLNVFVVGRFGTVVRLSWFVPTL